MIEYERLKFAIESMEDRCGRVPEPGTVDAVVLAAARAHLATLPKTKMVERWHVQYANEDCEHIMLCKSKASAEYEAERLAAFFKGARALYPCVRVTGPHQHEVPA